MVVSTWGVRRRRRRMVLPVQTGVSSPLWGLRDAWARQGRLHGQVVLRLQPLGRVGSGQRGCLAAVLGRGPRPLAAVRQDGRRDAAQGHECGRPGAWRSQAPAAGGRACRLTAPGPGGRQGGGVGGLPSGLWLGWGGVPGGQVFTRRGSSRAGRPRRQEGAVSRSWGLRGPWGAPRRAPSTRRSHVRVCVRTLTPAGASLLLLEKCHGLRGSSPNYQTLSYVEPRAVCSHAAQSRGSAGARPVLCRAPRGASRRVPAPGPRKSTRMARRPGVRPPLCELEGRLPPRAGGLPWATRTAPPPHQPRGASSALLNGFRASVPSAPSLFPQLLRADSLTPAVWARRLLATVGVGCTHPPSLASTPHTISFLAASAPRMGARGSGHCRLCARHMESHWTSELRDSGPRLLCARPQPEGQRGGKPGGLWGPERRTPCPLRLRGEAQSRACSSAHLPGAEDIHVLEDSACGSLLVVLCGMRIL